MFSETPSTGDLDSLLQNTVDLEPLSSKPEHIYRIENFAVSLIVERMSEFQTNPTVMLNGSAALAGLAIDKVKAGEIVKAGGMALIAKAMCEVLKVLEVLEVFKYGDISLSDCLIWNCVCIFARLAKYSSNVTQILEVGGLELIVAAMRRFPNNKTIIQFDVFALASLAENSEAIAKILEVGGLELIVGAMRQFPRDKNIIRNCIGTFLNLAKYSSNVTQILEVGGLELIVAAMKEFPAEQNIIQDCVAVFSLLVKDPEAIAKILEVGGLELIVAAMKQFPVNTNIIHNSCFVLGCVKEDSNDGTAKASSLTLMTACVGGASCAGGDVIESKGVDPTPMG